MIIYYTGSFSGSRAESRRLLAKAIAEYTGDAGQAEQLVSELKTGEQGKPYIEGFDYFSISHTGGIWAVLIDTRECGLDLQLGKKCDITAIAKKIYSSEDAENIASMNGEDPAKAFDEFFRLWTRREALVKAIGGSVYETELPSVSEGNPVLDQKSYIIKDIGIPDMETVDGARLHGAVCVEDVKENTENVLVFQPLE